MSPGSDESCSMLASCREIPCSPGWVENTGRKQQCSMQSKYLHIAVRNSQKSAELSLTSIPWQMYMQKQSQVHEARPRVTFDDSRYPGDHLWLSHRFQWGFTGVAGKEGKHVEARPCVCTGGVAVPRCLGWQGCPFILSGDKGYENLCHCSG